MAKDQLSKRIRAFRKLRGITQLQLAEMTGMSVSIIGELERGNRLIHPHGLELIANALQVATQELLGDD